MSSLENAKRSAPGYYAHQAPSLFAKGSQRSASLTASVSYASRSLKKSPALAASAASSCSGRRVAMALGAHSSLPF
jgi:hypothetical protein